MGRWPPRPPRSKFRRISVDYCDRFVREARIREYGAGGRESGDISEPTPQSDLGLISGGVYP